MFFGLAALSPVFGPIFPIAVLRGGGAASSFGLAIPLKQELRLPSLRILLSITLIAALDTIGFLAYDFGTLSGEAILPIVVTISGLFGAVTVVLARVFYGDKLERIQIVGVMTILLGVSVLLFLNPTI